MKKIIKRFISRKKEVVTNEEQTNMLITKNDIQKAFPLTPIKNIDLYYDAIIETFEKYDISTPERQAAFLSQCAHESANFTRVVENLNYADTALVRVWPRHFPTLSFARQYHRQPEKIANRAYANRMGNGDESSGDGWKFRGRGFIQVTGKSNYTECGKDLKLNLLKNPELLEQSPAVVLSAGWFWGKNNLNAIADREDITLLTRRINGGTHGLEDRIQKYNSAIKIFRK